MNANRTAFARTIAALLALGLGASAARADEHGRATLLVTSTNNASANAVAIFKLNPSASTATLSYVNTLTTGGAGGAGGNAGIVQFEGEVGAVANYGSNSVTQLVRYGDAINIGRTVPLAAGCVNPVSVALKHDHLYAVGANCIESHRWPSGSLEGSTVSLPDTSAAQVVVGQTWAAVTLKSGSVVQAPLGAQGALTGASVGVTLPSGANNTPLGAAFWHDVLGFNPAHSPDSLALVNGQRTVYPIQGPTPAFPNGNAPCWLAKGPGNLWYAGNTPAGAISIFFSDAQGGSFYKSVPLPGAPTDLAVSPDGKWLAAIYVAADGAHIGLFSIDAYGDLTLNASSAAVGIASFNGIAFSQ